MDVKGRLNAIDNRLREGIAIQQGSPLALNRSNVDTDLLARAIALELRVCNAYLHSAVAFYHRNPGGHRYRKILELVGLGSLHSTAAVEILDPAAAHIPFISTEGYLDSLKVAETRLLEVNSNSGFSYDEVSKSGIAPILASPMSFSKTSNEYLELLPGNTVSDSQLSVAIRQLLPDAADLDIVCAWYSSLRGIGQAARTGALPAETRILDEWLVLSGTSDNDPDGHQADRNCRLALNVEIACLESLAKLFEHTRRRPAGNVNWRGQGRGRRRGGRNRYS
jgi:hypothetical protein